jgi:hypothetical protein
MSKEMTECIIEALQAVQGANFTGATADNITSIACTLYINSNKGGSGGGFKGGNGGGSSWNKPPNQVMQVGAPCDTCGTPLKLSKKGNPFCSCWFNN